MPIIKITMTEKTKQEKRRLICEITKVVSGITGLPKETVTVILDEKSSDNMAVGGYPLSDIFN